TGADVLAPTKPAWTDTNGRVYTSDADIGPDGNRQPRIPPNGEWQTHRPDGTTTKASDDGFVPGTKDTDKQGLDPTDARDRGKKDSPEAQRRKAIRDAQLVKANTDEDWLRKYYRESDGHRHDRHAVDENDNPVPKIRWKDGQWEAVEDLPEPLPPQFDVPNIDEVRHGPANRPSTDGWREDSLEQVDSAIENRRQAIADRQNALATHGDPSPELSTAHGQQGKAAEAMGEQVGDHATREKIHDQFSRDPHDPDAPPNPHIDMRTRQGDPPYDDREVIEIVDTRSGEVVGTAVPRHVDSPGSGRFDRVWEIHDRRPGVPTPTYEVVEAKAPGGKYSKRDLPDGSSVSQCRRDYFDDVVRALKDSNDPADIKLGLDLEHAVDQKRVNYVEVRARVVQDSSGHTYGGYDRKPVKMY
ncbi:hypothetical protein ADK67_34880, partial [Saccharothrix sp. NRRL B-16348]